MLTVVHDGRGVFACYGMDKEGIECKRWIKCAIMTITYEDAKNFRRDGKDVKMQRVDLHMHTTASDGTMTPRELIERIKAEEICLFSVTDHDSIDNIKETIEVSQEAHVDFVPGVEISVTHQGTEIHLLTYGIDIEAPRLLERVNINKQIRERHNRAMIEYASQFHESVSLDGYENFQRNPSDGGWKAVNYLTAVGAIEDIGDFFQMVGNLELKLVFDPLETVLPELVSMGYVVVLAHPPAYDSGRRLQIEYLDKLVALGLSGIECYSPYYKNPEDYKYYVDYCEKHGLIVTSGSDYHGDFIRSRHLGTPAVDKQQMSYERMVSLVKSPFDAIKVFEQIKRMVQMGQGIGTEIQYILSRNWGRIEDNDAVFSVDLKQISAFHRNLIRQMHQRLKEAESEINKKLVQQHLSVGECLENAEDGKCAKGILLFNRSDIHYIVGDLHSDADTLSEILKRTAFYEKVAKGSNVKWIFVGDYVDRGRQHLKTLEHLMMLSILYPRNIFMLRGNHDGGILLGDGSLKLAYGVPEKDDHRFYFPLFMKELENTNSTLDRLLLGDYLNLFDEFPYLAFLKKPNEVVQCVHGGLPRIGEVGYSHLKTVSDLTSYEDEKEHILLNLLWSDPYRGTGDLRTGMKRFYFTESDYQAYKQRFGVTTVYRGHEVVEEGVREHFDGSLFTVFSSGGSKTTYYGEVKPKIVRLDEKGARAIIDIY